MRFGIVSPPVSGHIHPFGALGRELIERGHQVTLLHMEDVRAKATAEGLDFLPIGQTDHPPGTLAISLRKLGQLQGLAALRFTIQEIVKTTEMFCRDAPEAIRAAGIEALLVDQTEPCGGSIADHLGIPFVTVCNALNLNQEPSVPPPFTSFAYRDSAFARVRNQLGYRIAGLVMLPIAKVVSRYREKWGQRPYSDPQASFSRRAQISQLPASFDYPRKTLGDHFHYTGPLRKANSQTTPFPWERLDGRPLVYASLGTLQNGREPLFRAFAEACAPLSVQLVMTHGGGLDERTANSFPGAPVVVSYAPQLDVLRRATLTLTHAGLNTVLDSLSCGVPLVAVPITYEQPAIAQRVRWSGAGESIQLGNATPDRIRSAVQQVMGDPNYRKSAAKIESSIREAGGVSRAADIVEAVTESA
jgi:zeaxanthin glucosyltransferase